MSEECKWLHEQLEPLPMVTFPFNLNALPLNGIYFFYEQGENWGHGGDKPRIVRIGTHKGDNFRNRIKEHFLLDDNKMDFDQNKPGPRERSIFRKHLGSSFLNKAHDEYLSTWEIDFTSRDKREKFGRRRDIPKEKRIENETTNLLRKNFSFRFIVVEGQEQRIGVDALESRLIGTVSHCSTCQASPNWLGHHSARETIRNSGLWLVQGLKTPPIDETGQKEVVEAVKRTTRFVRNYCHS